MGNIWKSVSFILFFLNSSIQGKTQTPFDCNGRVYRVVEEQGGTTFQELLIHPEKQEIKFLDLRFFRGIKINGIGYRQSDNLIYGLLLGTTYRLCRIDANFNVEELRVLNLPNNLLFVSGDISPDNKYLVLLGYSPTEPGNLLALVDLETPEFQTEIFPISILGRNGGVKCADIAFHPTDGSLYGYDHEGRRLIKIDLEHKQINTSLFPSNDIIKGNIPSIFFDAFGNLFGIGSEREVQSNRSWFHFNTVNGQVEKMKDLLFEGNQDGASCPYKIHLLNKVSRRSLYRCTEATFELVIINKSPFIQRQIQLKDTLPQGVTIIDLEKQPFGGNIISAIGSNILAIDDMTIPIGIDTIRFKVEIENSAPEIQFYNHAFLFNINNEYQIKPDTVLSDDPLTPAFNDPTFFKVSGLKVEFDDPSVTICAGQTALISVSLEGDYELNWSTGSNSNEIRVNNSGFYSLTITTSCEKATGTLEVGRSDINVVLPKSISIEEGEQVRLSPQITSESPLVSFFWKVSPFNNLNCNTCENIEIYPEISTVLTLSVENEDGCVDQEQTRIEVNDFEILFPNVFSPNGDGINDTFYFQGRSTHTVSVLRIFDRWGDLVYEKENIMTNDPSSGWNGTIGKKIANSGTYIWQAEFVAKNRQSEIRSGSVLLMR